MFKVMFVNGSGALVHLDGLSVVAFDRTVHAEHVSCIQVWGDIIIVGNYDGHEAMFQNYERWSRNNANSSVEFLIPMPDSMYMWGPDGVFAERYLACVVRRGLEGVWAWDAVLHSGSFETPLGARPAMRYLFEGLGIVKIV